MRTGSVSAAADDLSVTHGAVSKQLAHLEQWLGRPLFSGRRGGMVANAAGERLAAAVGGALEEIETALDDVLASDRQEVLTATFDLDALAALRASWGVFRDRRPELYGPIATLDGAPVGAGGRG